MSGYPDHRTYRELYSRFLGGKDIDTFKQLFGPLEGKDFLELCCGEGQLTRAAFTAGAGTAAVVDAETLMIPTALKTDSRVDTRAGHVREVLSQMKVKGELFHVVACRQAVNYWLSDTSAGGLVASVLRKDGVFAFNTFNTRPLKKPRVLEYEHAGSQFAEVSWLVGNTVHHVQIREGMAPHATSFLWISPKQFRERLEPFFRVREQRSGKTSFWHCVKK